MSARVETIVKEDGRYLIYYSWPDNDEPDPSPDETADEDATDEPVDE